MEIHNRELLPYIILYSFVKSWSNCIMVKFIQTNIIWMIKWYDVLCLNVRIASPNLQPIFIFIFNAKTKDVKQVAVKMLTSKQEKKNNPCQIWLNTVFTFYRISMCQWRWKAEPRTTSNAKYKKKNCKNTHYCTNIPYLLFIAHNAITIFTRFVPL